MGDKIRMYDHLGGGEMDSLGDAKRMVEKASKSVEDGYSAIKILVVPRTEPLEGYRVLKHAATLMEASSHRSRRRDRYYD